MDGVAVINSPTQLIGGDIMYVFRVTTAHKTYGKNFASYTVQATSAKAAIKKAEHLHAEPQEFAFEVEYIATLD
jgi:hypothetical protein